MKNIIRNLFCLSVFIIPIYFNYFTEEPFELNKISIVYLFTFTIVAVWLVKIFQEKHLLIIKDKIILLTLTFLIINIASLIFSIHPYSSFFGNSYRWNGGILSLISYITLFLVFIETFQSDKKILNEIIGSILLSSIFVSLYGIYQIINLGSLDTRIISTFGQPNYLGAYLAFVLPLNLYYILKEKNVTKKIGLFLLFLTNFFVLFSTGSRAAWLAILVAFLILGLVYGKKIISKLKWDFLTLVVLVALILVPFYKQIGSRINTRLFTETNQIELTGSYSLRIFAWKSSLQVFIHNPILGTGPETLMYSSPKYIDPKINNHIEWGYKFDKAHNELLDTLANTGIFSFIIYLVLLFFAIKKSLFNREKNLELKFLGIALISIFITNLFGFSCVSIAFYFWLTLALIIIQQKSAIKEIKLSNKTSLLICFFAFLFSCLIAFSWFNVYLANIYFKNGNLEKAVKYNPSIDRYHGELAIKYLQEDRTEKALQEARLSVEANKNNADNYRVLATVLGNNNNIEEALSSYTEALKLEPTNPKIYLEKARYLIKINQKVEAKEALEKALELKTNYLEAQELLKTIN